jgi:hypothetical protein
MSVSKNRIGIAVGAITAMILIAVGEMVIDKQFPHPPIDVKDKAAVAAMMSHMPMNFFLALIANYAFASLVGGVVATLVSGRSTNNPPVVTGLLLMLAGIVNLVMLPHPFWFGVASSLVYIPFALLGFMVAKRKTAI